MIKIISEYGIIRKSSDYDLTDDSFAEIFMCEKAFESIKKFCFEQTDDGILQYSIKRGKEQIQVKNHVGLIQLKDGTQLEILPKITDSKSPTEAKSLFLKMLRCVVDLPFRKFNFSKILTIQNQPIFEIFISAFINEVESIISIGLSKHFVNQSANQNYLKGKILINENIKQNSFKSEQIFVEFDEFWGDIAQNRIIKKCLEFLYFQSNYSKNQFKIKQLLVYFEDVKTIDNLEKDWVITDTEKRIFRHYQTALDWAKVFLKNQTFSTFSGQSIHYALLFPMEKLFEAYIAHGFKQYCADYEVFVQNKSKFLIENHQQKPKFGLQPDIIVQNQDLRIIIDTKWKLINASKPKENYGIEQADLYQMYAYGKKYRAKDLCLIYPSNEHFKETLQVFDYESDLRLWVVAFDLKNDLENELKKVFDLVKLVKH
jgi:5-methylcytosine-specific restriction enzyme subunit McrC